MEASIFGCDDTVVKLFLESWTLPSLVVMILFDSIVYQLLIRYGTKFIRHTFIYTLTYRYKFVCTTMFLNVRFDYAND